MTPTIIQTVEATTAMQTMAVVLGKFGLVQFEPVLAKLETRPFGFWQSFPIQIQIQYKTNYLYWYGFIG
jgi:hypothetical protein